MKVSIVTVVKNAADTLEDTLKSIYSQTHQDIEHIVIDGISTDGTLGIIEKYRDKISYFVSEPDTGLYNAMNKGIKAATGDILFFLNGDDRIYSKTTIVNIVETFNQTNVDIIYGDLITVNKKNNMEELQSGSGADKFFWMNQCLCHQVIFYKAELFKKYGFYDEKYRIAADYDFNLRCIFKNKTKAVYIPKIISKFTVGGLGHQNKEIYDREQMEIAKKFFTPYQLAVKNFLFKNCRSIIRNKIMRKILNKII